MSDNQPPETILDSRNFVFHAPLAENSLDTFLSAFEETLYSGLDKLPDNAIITMCQDFSSPINVVNSAGFRNRDENSKARISIPALTSITHAIEIRLAEQRDMLRDENAEARSPDAQEALDDLKRMIASDTKNNSYYLDAFFDNNAPDPELFRLLKDKKHALLSEVAPHLRETPSENTPASINWQALKKICLDHNSRYLHIVSDRISALNENDKEHPEGVPAINISSHKLSISLGEDLRDSIRSFTIEDLQRVETLLKNNIQTLQKQENEGNFPFSSEPDTIRTTLAGLSPRQHLENATFITGILKEINHDISAIYDSVPKDTPEDIRAYLNRVDGEDKEQRQNLLNNIGDQLYRLTYRLGDTLNYSMQCIKEQAPDNIRDALIREENAHYLANKLYNPHNQRKQTSDYFSDALRRTLHATKKYLPEIENPHEAEKQEQPAPVDAPGAKEPTPPHKITREEQVALDSQQKQIDECILNTLRHAQSKGFAQAFGREIPLSDSLENLVSHIPEEHGLRATIMEFAEKIRENTQLRTKARLDSGESVDYDKEIQSQHLTDGRKLNENDYKELKILFAQADVTGGWKISLERLARFAHLDPTGRDQDVVVYTPESLDKAPDNAPKTPQTNGHGSQSLPVSDKTKEKEGAEKISKSNNTSRNTIFAVVGAVAAIAIAALIGKKALGGKDEKPQQAMGRG